MAFERSRLISDFGDPAGEARACREDSALFDFTFLDCIRVEGPVAQSVIEAYIQRPLNNLVQGGIAYAVRTGSFGAALADLTVWRTGENSFEVMSGRGEERTALMACASAQVKITSVGDARAVFAVQGPGALDALRRLGKVETLARLSYFHFAQMELAGALCTIGRLGYTGEPGFEIILPRREGPRVWRELSRYSRPAGFIAADTLRIEAGFVLFTNEFSLPVTPAEAGLRQFHFEQATPKTGLRLVSFRANADRLSLPWKGEGPLDRPAEPETIAITSACSSVVAKGVLGLGFVTASTADEATLHDPSGQFREVRQTPLPFYDTHKRRPRQAWR